MPLRRVTKAFAVGAIAVMVPLSAPLALAHDSVIGGNVVSDAPLPEFPREIVLEFSGIPKDDFNTFAVTNTETGEVLFDATPTNNGRELSIEVPAAVQPGPGKYQVGFQITSSDGHATRGSVPFSVAGGAAEVSGTESGVAAAEAASPAEAADGGLPTAAKAIIGIGGLVAIGAVIAVFAAKSRQSTALAQAEKAGESSAEI